MRYDKENFNWTLSQKIYLSYCNNLPALINKNILTRFELVLEKINSIIESIKLPIFEIGGKEKHSNSYVKVIFCGNQKSFYYLGKKIFDNSYTKKKIGEISIYNHRKLNEIGASRDADIVIIKISRFFKHFFKKNNFYIMPEWVNLVLDTSKTYQEIKEGFSSGAKKDIKMIKKYGYDYELTDDEEKLKYFYYNMFLPYILKKHSEETEEYYLRYIKMMLGRSKLKLLLVRYCGKYICGGLVTINKNKAILPSMGVLHAEEKYVKSYATSALFYFHILSAIKAGVNEINYGDTRTILSDGVFQYKKKWGMKIKKSLFQSNVLALKINKKNPGVLSFLKNNPFIFEENNSFKGLILYDEDKPLTHLEIYRLYKRFYAPGIEKLEIISPMLLTGDNKGFQKPGSYVVKQQKKFIDFTNKKENVYVVTPK